MHVRRFAALSHLTTCPSFLQCYQVSVAVILGRKWAVFKSDGCRSGGCKSILAEKKIHLFIADLQVAASQVSRRSGGRKKISLLIYYCMAAILTTVAAFPMKLHLTWNHKKSIITPPNQHRQCAFSDRSYCQNRGCTNSEEKKRGT